ncbi:MAG TPA: pantetheine-phosphate adenylyltransferase [Oligoflexia bacterium]|nr:pantetheine-phosphate adenylyltransferase [Oligoflexia bacterium]HMR23757.1 pantetheine-phosphate adenylyltransferase [Oligoflexia bacterium]
MTKTKNNIVVYPGFFDPMTLGHLNIIERAAKIYEQVIVAIAADSPKKSLITLQDRIELAKNACTSFDNVDVEAFSGLLMRYVKSKDSHVILRGIRTVSDFEYEFQMSLANKKLESSIETVFMMTDAKYSFLSSTLIKEIARLNGNISEMVPQEVERKMKEIFAYELTC